MNAWSKLFRPVVVLTAICVVISAALALTDAVTRPIIDEAKRTAQERARQELLPDADGFTRVGTAAERVDDVYTANNGAGTVVTAHARGYGGEMTVMVAFAPDGTILRLKVTESAETQGIGSKVARDPDFWTRFEGLTAEPLVLGRDVDALSGATVSSKALTAAVNAAIGGYQAAAGR